MHRLNAKKPLLAGIHRTDGRPKAVEITLSRQVESGAADPFPLERETDLAETIRDLMKVFGRFAARILATNMDGRLR